MASKHTEELTEITCVVCFKDVDIYSIGQCDHPVCYDCSTRMRVLCRRNECPICRQDMPKVIFTKFKELYNNLKDVNGKIEKKFQIVFETNNEQKAYDALLSHECPKCYKIFENFSFLRDHVRRVHQLNYCDLCVDNLKIYSRERRCYTRVELSQHRKDGDPDNRSHRGHPLCEFCETRYMDSDELYRHLRRDHLYCHFCDADGLHHYYSSYDCLRDHFRSEHYLCEEGDCFNEKFTPVFRSEIDLKAHKTTTHGKVLGKAGLKQARTLALAFTLTPRPRPLHNRGVPRIRDDVADVPETSGAVGGSVSSVGGLTEDQNLKKAPELKREEDFPALGSDSSGTSVSLRVRSAKQPSVSIEVNHSRFSATIKSSPNTYNHHFPALDNSSIGEAAASPSWSGCSSGTSGRRPVEQKPSSNLHPREDFPRLLVSQNSNTISSSTRVGTQPKPTEPEHPFVHPPCRSKKTKSKSGKAGIEVKTPEPASCHSSVNGESKTKKNKKQKKLPPNYQVQNDLCTTSIKNNYNNIVENDYKTLSIVSEKVSVNREFQNQHTPRQEEFPKLGAPPGFSSLPPAAVVPRWEVKKPRKPPPGLEKSPPGLEKPPPGLPPPGFSGLNGGFPPLGVEAVEDNVTEDKRYITPTDFIKRNTSLVKLINTSLIGETPDDFKQISFAFRRGCLSAPEYYAHCKEMLGTGNFKDLFPELLALLPDINKQQELWKMYQKDNRSLGSKSSKKKGVIRLEACATCEQVLLSSDLRQHLSEHNKRLNRKTKQNNPWSKSQ